MSNEENLNENIDGTDTPVTERDDAEKTVTSDAAETQTNEAEKTEQSKTPAEKEKAAPAPEKRKADKPIKQKKPNDRKYNTRLFKMIYYPVLALFVALMFVFSIIDGVYGYSPSAYDAAYFQAVNAHISTLSEASRSAMSSSVNTDGSAMGIAKARNYIVDTLVAGGFRSVEEEKTEPENDEQPVTQTDWFVTDAGTTEPTVTLHTSPLTAELQERMDAPHYLVGADITNIVAAIPSGKENAASIVITLRYDSRTDTDGAAANAAFVANVMQTLVEYVKSGVKFGNDLVVVFTEDLNYSYGAYSFFDTFKGFDNCAARAKAGINLDAFGNAGTLALTDASGAGLDYINSYTKVSGSILNSSAVADSIDDALINKGAVKAFGNIPAVQVAVIGGTDAAQSALDNVDNLSQAIVRQQAQFVKDYIDEFANTPDAFTDKPADGVAVFSYFDAGSIAYTPTAAYVIGALALALAAAVIVVMAVKKTFSIKKMFIALGVELLVIVSTLAALLATYFVVTLMLTGFGVLPIHAITSIRYFNAGILIAAIIVSVAAAFGFTTLYKKLFRVTSSEVVRGTAMLIGLCGAIMSFACPAYSFITVWLGILMLAVLLVTALLHKPFKAKFGIGMDQLYLYAVPVALCLPLVMTQITALIGLLPLLLMPVIMTLFTAMLGVAVPYLDRTQAMLDKVAKKLPMRTIRVERTVTEKVEDRAKRGKFTEKTFRKVEKEKVAVNYKNYFGISVLTVLGIVVALFSGGFGVNFGKSLTGYYAYEDAIYNDALVYEWEKTSSGTVQRVVIDDLMTYKFARYSLDDLEWDGENGRYSKVVNYNTNSIVSEPTVSKTDGEYTIRTFDGARSYVTLTIPSARSITKITVKELSKEGNPDYEGYSYEFNNRNEIVLRMPYGFGDFKMEIEGASPSRFEYQEYREVVAGSSDAALDNLDDWNRMKRDYAGTDVAENLRGGIVVKCTLTV